MIPTTNLAARLLAPLINLAQEAEEHLSLQPTFNLNNLPNLRVQLAHNALFVLRVHFANPELLKQRLDLLLLLRVLPPIILIKHLTLFRRRELDGGVYDPRTLVVDDVGPDFADLLWRAGKVEEVVLDLEVLAEREKDRACKVVRFDRARWVRGDGVRLGDLRCEHRTRHGQVEGIVGCLVNDNETVSRREDGQFREEKKEVYLISYFSKENLLRSILSSGAVMRSMSWPNSV